MNKNEKKRIKAMAADLGYDILWSNVNQAWVVREALPPPGPDGTDFRKVLGVKNSMVEVREWLIDRKLAMGGSDNEVRL